jgi:peroxiredoxin
VATLQKYIDAGGPRCALGPHPVEARSAAAGWRIAVFALLGAYTQTFSVQHLPGYVARDGDLAAGVVDEIWCVWVNDAPMLSA